MNTHRKRVRHYNDPGHAHFLTFSCYKNLPLLTRERPLRWFIDAIIQAGEKYRFAVWAYVIMPEHAHLLVFPQDPDYDISTFLKSVKQSTSRKARIFLKDNDAGWLGKLSVAQGKKSVFRFWLAGPGYDRNVRSEEELFEKINYIHNNPVRRGLVNSPLDWEWSSARWYEGERDVPLPIDDSTLPPFTRTNEFVRGTR